MVVNFDTFLKNQAVSPLRQWRTRLHYLIHPKVNKNIGMLIHRYIQHLVFIHLRTCLNIFHCNWPCITQFGLNLFTILISFSLCHSIDPMCNPIFRPFFRNLSFPYFIISNSFPYSAVLTLLIVSLN